eukprot:jgi/Chlat1/5115/Chrsp33S08966
MAGKAAKAASNNSNKDLSNSKDSINNHTSSSGPPTPNTSGGGGGESVITQYMGNVMASRQMAGLKNPALRKPAGVVQSLLCCVRPQEQVYAESYMSLQKPPLPRRSDLAYGAKRPAIIPVMPALVPEDEGKKTLVLDLDETLVHSSFKPVQNADYIIPVEIDGKITDVYVLKRPWVDDFMRAVGDRYEVVVYTASLAKYANPLLDLLDTAGVVRHRLFREDCTYHEGNYIKDLSLIGRELSQSIIIDNSPHSYAFHPENAIPIGSFIDDPNDQELLDMIPYLMEVQDAEDVREALVNYRR